MAISTSDLSPQPMNSDSAPEAESINAHVRISPGLNQALRRYHDHEQRVSGRLPADHPFYANEVVVMTPRYLGMVDSSASSAWGLEVGDKLKARIYSSPEEATNLAEVEKQGTAGKPIYGGPTAEQLAAVQSVLDLLDQNRPQ